MSLTALIKHFQPRRYTTLRIEFPIMPAEALYARYPGQAG